MEKEIRTLTQPIKLQEIEENEGKKYIVGYALKFNSESHDLGGFVEIIEPTALEGTDLSDVRALFNHNADKILGRSKSGTLKLSVDEIGLRYEIDMPDTAFAKGLMQSMERGDIDQSSFGFRLDSEQGDDDWRYDEDRDIVIRTIKRFRSIFDVSIVTYPAYNSTESLVATRSFEQFKNKLEESKQQEVRQKEQALRKKQIEIELELL